MMLGGSVSPILQKRKLRLDEMMGKWVWSANKCQSWGLNLHYLIPNPTAIYTTPQDPMDGGAWWATVHGVARSRTRLSDFTLTFHFHALEKEMATHSSVLAWRIPGMVEPGGLPSMGSHRVGHDWSDLAAAAQLPLAFLRITENCRLWWWQSR